MIFITMDCLLRCLIIELPLLKVVATCYTRFQKGGALYRNGAQNLVLGSKNGDRILGHNARRMGPHLKKAKNTMLINI